MPGSTGWPVKVRAQEVSFDSRDLLNRHQTTGRHLLPHRHSRRGDAEAAGDPGKQSSSCADSVHPVHQQKQQNV
jgi:hypothetical protein